MSKPPLPKLLCPIVSISSCSIQLEHHHSLKPWYFSELYVVDSHLTEGVYFPLREILAANIPELPVLRSRLLLNRLRIRVFQSLFVLNSLRLCFVQNNFYSIIFKLIITTNKTRAVHYELLSARLPNPLHPQKMSLQGHCFDQQSTISIGT